MPDANVVADGYRDLSPLRTRILTHQRYSERPDDPDLDVIRAIALDGSQALLDVGSGTGVFLGRLRAEGHTGRLCAVDASQAAVDAAGAVAGVTATLGDAQELPFDAAEFDAVTARHMLYHVDDPTLAVREARRVLRPGGRFAAVVNRTGTTPLMAELVDTVVRRHGVRPPPGPGDRVHAGNLPEMVEEAFGACDVRTVDSALVFHEPEPVARYCLSTLTLRGVPGEGPLRDAVARDVEAEVRLRFAALDGVWRDPKGYVVCTGVR